MTRTVEQIKSELLVLQYQRGDERALEEIITLWERPLFYFIRRMVRREEDTWDVLQEVWCSVIRHIRTLRDPAVFVAWLYRLAHNAAVSHLRKNSSMDPFAEDEVGTEVGEPKEAVLDLFDAQALHWALDQLSLPHREVLTLHFLEGFSVAEIAGVTGVPEGTVKSRMHHAKRALREVLRKEAASHDAT